MKFIETKGHGYLKVSIPQLMKAMKKGFKPTSFSFFNESYALLEEDQDMSEFVVTHCNNASERKQFYRQLQKTKQVNINKRLYSRLPEKIEELEAMISIYDLSAENIGKKMEDTLGRVWNIIDVQETGTKGYIYEHKEKKKVFVMRPCKIKAIFS